MWDMFACLVIFLFAAGAIWGAPTKHDYKNPPKTLVEYDYSDFRVTDGL
jgi:hypothetical protein